MMVVGGIGTDGDLWPRIKVDPPNRGKVIKVYAPCYDITIPNAITGGYRAPAEVEGVSYGKPYRTSHGSPLQHDRYPWTDFFHISFRNNPGLGAYFLGLSSLYDSLTTITQQKGPSD